MATKATYVLIGDALIAKSIDGVTTEEYLKLQDTKKNPFAGYGSDTLGNSVNGVLNHADGKHYDSKSQFERAVRAKGCRIVGNDLNSATYKTPLERGVRGDFNARREIKQAVEKVMGC